MAAERNPIPKNLSPFEKFVQAVLRVPKAAVDEAEAKREKRGRKTVARSAND